METIFKEGDRVFDIIYGWGTVERIVPSEYVYVYFDIDKSLSVWYGDISLRILSFTEYTLKGFSQERPEPAPKLGDIVWGKGFHTTDWSIGHYLGRQHASYKISSTPNGLSYWLAFTITTKNPYANEQ